MRSIFSVSCCFIFFTEKRTLWKKQKKTIWGVYGDGAVAESTVRKGFNSFRSEHFNLASLKSLVRNKYKC